MKKVLVFILLIIAMHSFGTTYYVSNLGSDSNAGTSTGLPWQTITKVNSSTFSPGDIILFNGGQTFTGTLIISSSGSSGNPIIFQSYGTGNATIYSPGLDGVDIQDQGYITIQNLIFLGDGTSDTFGISPYVTTNGNVKYNGIIITNNTISNYTSGVLIGAFPSDNGTSGFNNLEISNNTIHNCISNGIQIYGASYGNGFDHTNVSIFGNIIYNIVGRSGTGSASGSGILLAEVNGGTIQNNIVHDCGVNNTSASGPVAIWIYDCTVVTIQFNESYNQKTNSGTDGGGFDIDGGCSNSVMQYNYSHDNYGPGFLMYSFNDGGITTWDNNICRYNISVNDGQSNSSNIGSIVVGSGSTMTNCYVYNNTVYQSLGTSAVAGFFGASISSTTGIFSNNILYSANNAALIQTIGTNPSAITITGNDYYNTGIFSIIYNGTTYTSFASWQTASSKELISAVNVGKTLDPMLASPGTGGMANYQIKNISPVSANGLKLPTVYLINVGTQDYFNNSIPNLGGNYSIGAHQPIRTTGRIFF